jgi:DNA repair protein RadC
MDNPREKVEMRGPASMDDVELLRALLGGRGNGKDLVRTSERVLRLLKEHLWMYKRNFGEFYRMLLKIDGLGTARASAVSAAVELGMRLGGGRAPSVKGARDILPFVSAVIPKMQECFICLYMDGANRVISSRVVTVGLVDQALVHPREVFSEAVTVRAAKIIVAHNHPAGILTPSPEDITITNNLVEASRILGICFLDHIIVTDEGYFSFREKGLL